MTRHAWSNRYATGLPKIDQEHRELFDCVNAFEEALRTAQGRGKISETLSFLLDYTGRHFKHEEEEMRAAKYPDWAAHKVLHDRLFANVARLVEEARSGRMLLTTAVSQFLYDWITHHILEKDMAYLPWLKSSKPQSN